MTLSWNTILAVPKGCELIYGNREGHFESQIWDHAWSDVKGLQVNGDLSDPTWGFTDQSHGIDCMIKTCDKLNVLQPRMLVWDFGGLSEIGLAGLRAVEDSLLMMYRSGTLMRMILNPQLEPPILHTHMLTLAAQATDVNEAIWDLYREFNRAA